MTFNKGTYQNRSHQEKILSRIKKAGGIINKTKNQSVDLLTIDPDIPQQNFFIFSYIMSDNPDIPMMFKSRGNFNTLEEAQRYTKELRKKDKKYNIYIGEVGKWTSCLTPSGLEKSNINQYYADESMNKIIATYQEQETQNLQHHQERRNIAISRSRELSCIQRILLKFHAENLQDQSEFDETILTFSDTETDEYYKIMLQKFVWDTQPNSPSKCQQIIDYLNWLKKDIEEKNQKYDVDFKMNVSDLQKNIEELQKQLKQLQDIENNSK